MKIKVLIADDNSFIREGMRIILTSFEEFEVVAAVEDGVQAVDYCKANPVDVVLLDIRMPNMTGVEAARRIVAETQAKPLMLTTFDDDEFILEAIQAGAKGYLLKNNDPERIRDAIKTVHHDHHVLQDVVVEKIRASLAAAASSSVPSSAPDKELGRPSAQERSSGGPSGGQSIGPSDGPIDRSLFTERELDIMELIAKGLSNKGIARKLFLSEGTVANHITSILGKTGLSHRTQIAIYYLTGEVHLTEE
ncbi:response regulator transcription factor [Gorillibacterium timonense]|uniref:response regulator transcription factor n=1 Tax=Gorillibacterium timonense TaxID=1689269 RepID=UPI0009EC7B84|nr:response regulator transcription factor [Gorillibacterium timonense]